jgi:hypothetical protein
MNHQIVNPEFDARHAGDVSTEAAETYIRAALRCMETDRRAGLASLDDMFRSGRPPRELDGRYAGEMLAVDIAPLISSLAAGAQERQRYWLGKRFDATTATGDNVMNNRVRSPMRFLLPDYRQQRSNPAKTFQALPFRTYEAPALFSADTMVLKIDYDIPENPPQTIRRVLDELVELADGYYLGRAFVRTWWGAWKLVAYFSLRMNSK